MRKWRNLQKHREAQDKGRAGIFKSLPAAHREVVRDYTHGRALPGAGRLRARCTGRPHLSLRGGELARRGRVLRRRRARCRRVSGETTRAPRAGTWLFEAVLRLRGDPARVQHNRYEIVPFSPGARSTHWSSINPVLGALRGRFVIAGDSILSFYTSPTGRYRGFECLQQRDARRYSVRGAMLEEDKVVSTWALELTAHLGRERSKKRS